MRILVPSGKCQCGCGSITTRVKMTRRGYKRGDFNRFCQGHGKRIVSHEDYFLQRVDKNGPVIRPELGQCWLWKGRVGAQGYGLVVHEAITAHRFSWLFHNGKIPRGKQVCHKCDVRLCVNPDHFFLGTARENFEDMRRKGRHSRGIRVRSAKLNERKVIELRELRALGASVYQLAEKFKLTPSGVYGVLQRRNWAWLK